MLPNTLDNLVCTIQPRQKLRKSTVNLENKDGAGVPAEQTDQRYPVGGFVIYCRKHSLARSHIAHHFSTP